ncbi:maleylpyruvate isomerase family mycothiol-dependent enzyme [Streptomyces sp. DSM 41527]|uniref:Maleylpyruvate isomerase family mycothiol-dependent enzyme n=1 Tax=Streptomyces mooreae TaxID=3075523 RepID=A0ABU2THR1_9ACTN|nr:maleylpyruvate isomerase family mycothiol-dependent enzyme [Streptomyces sp. DSM 41527]MDT0460468.1 maleylpyruvate isomerase family mycothiol-dependent enzyme [Streptomyces sp. DSM 41527]
MTLQGSLPHEEYCAQLLAETDAFRAIVRTADLSATVPTCPDWTLADLARHVGGAHRWAGALVATRATESVDLADVPEGAGPGGGKPGGEDAAALDAWLAAGAERTVAALREAGPDAEVWSWTTARNSGFWARRMTHETVVHRADAALTAGVPFEVPAPVAADCLEEWLQIGELPMVVARFAERGTSLLGPGRTIHVHATDAPPGVDAEWLLDLTGEAPTHRRTHEKAAVALRGPLTDVLQVLYRRLPADSDRVEVLGERALLDQWLEWASFG